MKTSGPQAYRRLPPPIGKHIVLVHQVALALGWTAARVRGVDDLLKPIRLSDGSRAYDVDRALAFIWVMDTCDAWSMECEACARSLRRSRRARSRAQRKRDGRRKRG